MTETRSEHSALGQASSPTDPRAKPPRPGPVATYAKPAPRLSRGWLLTPVVVVVASLAVWQGWVRMTAPALEDIRLYLVQKMSFPIILTEKGELKAHRSVDIRNGMDGESTIISIVPEGSMVEKGDLLVEMSSELVEDKLREETIEVNSARSRLETAESEQAIQIKTNEANIDQAATLYEVAKITLEKWENGDWPKQLQTAELAEVAALSRHEQAEAQVKVAQEGFDAKIVLLVELKGDRINLQERRIELDNARMDVKVLDYTRRMEKTTYEAAVRDAKAALDRAVATADLEKIKAASVVRRASEELNLQVANLDRWKERLAMAKIYAPQPGLVVYSNERYRGNSSVIDEGAKVYKRQKLLSLPDLSQMKLEVRVHEADAERIKPGLPVNLTISGISAEVEGASGEPARTSAAPKVFKGRVTKIAALADSRNRWLNPDLREFATEIMLDEQDSRLKPGMTAMAEIFIDHVEDVLAVPIQAVYGQAGKSYVFLDDGTGQPVHREVELGASNTTFVEITAGLEEGNKVYMAVSDDMLAMLPQAEGDDLRPDRQLLDARERLKEAREQESKSAGDSSKLSQPAAE